jgi:hypothetical protein
MKQTILTFLHFIIVTLLLVACTNDSTDITAEETGVKTVALNLGGDFTIEQLTRSTSVETAQDIYIFDYMDGKSVQTIHQQKGDPIFGSPRISLKYGKHHLYFIVANGTEPSITANIIRWQKVGDTFWGAMDVDINAKTGNTLDVTLERVVAQLKISSSDIIPSDAQYLKITPSAWYYGLDYTTDTPALSTSTLTIDNLDKGSYFSMTLYGFATKDEQKIDIVLDANTKYSNVTSVPIRANTVTMLRGNIFTASSTSGDSYTTPETFGVNIKVNSSWNTGYNMTW